MTPEKKVQTEILKHLKKESKLNPLLWYERRQAGGFSYKAGVSDIYFVYGGIHVEIEVKKPGGTLDPLQELWRDRCRQSKTLWFCVDSVEAFEEVFSEVKKTSNY